MAACLFAACTSAFAQTAARPVMLDKKVPLRAGTVLRERREIRVENGQTRQEIGKEVTSVATRFIQRVNLVRRPIGAEAEEVQVREFIMECVHFPAATPPAPDEQPSPLSSKTLRARKKSGHWDYDMLQGSPTREEKKSLDDLAFTADLLEILPAAIGSGARRPGEKWKVPLNAPRGKAYGWIVPESLEMAFPSVEERPDGPHAILVIEGRFHMERPMNFNARMDVTFTATIARRLTDMIDVDTKISGKLTCRADAVTVERQPILLQYDHPFTLTRTLKVGDK